MKFKDTKYGDLTISNSLKMKEDINVENKSTIIFEDIEEEFNEYKKFLIKEKEKEKLEKIKQLKIKKIKEQQQIKSKTEDYGYGF